MRNPRWTWPVVMAATGLAASSPSIDAQSFGDLRADVPVTSRAGIGTDDPSYSTSSKASLSEPQPPGKGTGDAIVPQVSAVEASMLRSRGARTLFRNGQDYIKYQQYEKALTYLREAERRQTELNASEKLSLKQAIETAQQGLRTPSLQSGYARTRRPQSGSIAIAGRSGTQQNAAATARTDAPADPLTLPASSEIVTRGSRSETAKDSKRDAADALAPLSPEILAKRLPSAADLAQSNSTFAARKAFDDAGSSTAASLPPISTPTPLSDMVKHVPESESEFQASEARPDDGTHDVKAVLNAARSEGTPPPLPGSPSLSVPTESIHDASGASPELSEPNRPAAPIVKTPELPRLEPSESQVTAEASRDIVPSPSLSVVGNASLEQEKTIADATVPIEKPVLTERPELIDAPPLPNHSDTAPRSNDTVTQAAQTDSTAEPAKTAELIDAPPLPNHSGTAPRSNDTVSQAAQTDSTAEPAKTAELIDAPPLPNHSGTAPRSNEPMTQAVEPKTGKSSETASEPIEATSREVSGVAMDKATFERKVPSGNVDSFISKAQDSGNPPVLTPLADEDLPLPEPRSETTPNQTLSATTLRSSDTLPPLPVTTSESSPTAEVSQPVRRTVPSLIEESVTEAMPPLPVTPVAISADEKSDLPLLPEEANSRSVIEKETMPPLPGDRSIEPEKVAQSQADAVEEPNSSAESMPPLPAEPTNGGTLPPLPTAPVMSQTSVGSQADKLPALPDTPPAPTSPENESLPQLPDAPPQQALATKERSVTDDGADAPALPADELSKGIATKSADSPAASGRISRRFLPGLSDDQMREIENLARVQLERSGGSTPGLSPLDSPPREAGETRRVPMPAGSNPMLGANEDPLVRLELPRAPSPAEARPIRAILLPEQFDTIKAREFQPRRKMWASAATAHYPLYFQDPSLERYGISVEQRLGTAGRKLTYPIDDPKESKLRNQIATPFFSSGLFALQIATWPFRAIADPPWESTYDLGYYRPGDLVPEDTVVIPWKGVGPLFRGNGY